MGWIEPKTDWYGKRDNTGYYTGDYFEISDAARLRDNALELLNIFGEKYSVNPVLMDFEPVTGKPMVFDISRFSSIIATWQPVYSSYFDVHMLSRIIIAVRNMLHCEYGVWRAFQSKYGMIPKENDYYELEQQFCSEGYQIANVKKPEEYLPEIRPILEEDGLWVDKYYQEYMFNYRELNALERGMKDLHASIGYKKQDLYQMFVWNLGIKKGF